MSTSATQQNWISVAKGSIPPYQVYTAPIQKSLQDEREYRVIKLENGLEAMLIHDPKTDKAAASLDVAVGHLHDPDDMPGLAHFCEHLLFMGTEQYPRENEYSEYLAKNNGSSNAYTGTTNTNFYFTVATTGLEGALSRFAAFFHSPLFAPSCTSRELNAVDSEHKKNHQSDLWRIFQLTKHLSKEGHVWRKFGSGNRSSLTQVGRDLKEKGLLKANGTANGNLLPTPEPSRGPSPSLDGAGESEDDGGVIGRETRRRLLEWWQREYSANRMHLCIIGKDSLDDLSDLASKLFSPIRTLSVDPLPTFPEGPYGNKEQNSIIRVSTVMSFHALEIIFPIPYQPPFWKGSPGSFVAHFVGHEGPGSLHSYLKSKHWIIALSAGPQTLARGFGTFKITLRLTKEGFDNYEEVSLAVFKYLSLLLSSPLPRWYQQEISTIRATRFRFAEKRRPEDYAVWVSEHMSWPVPTDRIISAPQLTEPWTDDSGERDVRDILNLLTVENSRIILMARKDEHERLTGNSKMDWQVEPWYGTEYVFEKYQKEFVKKAYAQNDIADLVLPGPNEFIPKNLDIDKKEVDQPLKRPHLIRDTPLSTLWYKKDDQFWVPKAQVIFQIRNPIVKESARNSVMTRLYADLVMDSLNAFAYDAEMAGLNYGFSPHSDGVFVSLNGYNDKLHILAKDVFERAKTLVVNPGRMAAKKEEMVRDWENFFLEQPYRLSDYYARYIMTEKQWTLQEKLAEIPSITAEELQAYITKFLSQIHMKVLAVGNFYKDEAIRLVEMTEQTLQASPLPSRDIFDLALVPQPGSNVIWSTPVPNPNDANSCITYYVHLGSALDPRNRVTVALLSQILSEPAFNVLRTREQLGYIVSCSSWMAIGDAEVGLRILVQSERGPLYLEERVEAFLDEMKVKLEKMTEEEFNEQKVGLEKKWREVLKNMSEETMRYWVHIDSGYLDFMRRSNDADLLPTITKEDVSTMFLTLVHPSSSTRAKLSVHLKSQKPRGKTMSKDAIKAFAEAVAQKGLPVDSQQFTGDKEPTVDQVLAFCKQAFAAAGPSIPQAIVDELLAKVTTLADQFPAESDYEGKLKEGAVVIEDTKDVKATLRQTQPSRPLIEWGDLPISRY
ncbi:insulin-degrading enzyme [Abortiporus biennis]|nr:insulin-degrading enzyme [Abortiporus biennis]